MKFCSLHHHSTFSFGDGFGTPAQHVARAAELGYPYMALTEHGNVSSHFQFEKAAIKAGVKPIFGMEAYCGSVTSAEDDPELAKRDRRTGYLPGPRSAYKYHLTILAANAGGYSSLNRICTASYLDFYYHPTVSGSVLADNSEGIIALSGCSGSLLACTLLGGKGIPVPDRPAMVEAEDVIWRFKEVFGDNYFLEIQPFYELEKTAAINKAYLELGAATDTPLVVTHDVHYPTMDDSEMQAVLHAVHRGKASVDDAMREWNYNVPMTLPESDDALHARLRKTGLSRMEAWDAIEMSAYVADRCNVTLPKASPLRYPAEEKDYQPWV